MGRTNEWDLQLRDVQLRLQIFESRLGRITDISLYFTWRYTEDYFHLYVPLSSTCPIFESRLGRITEIPLYNLRSIGMVYY